MREGISVQTRGPGGDQRRMIVTRQGNTALLDPPDGSLVDPKTQLGTVPWIAGPRSRVLLVEDDPNIALSLTIRLMNEGYDVGSASNGAVGLRHAVCFQALPDLILMDIMLPGIDGITVAESLMEHEITRDIPVIFITGSCDPSLRSRAQRMGAGFFEKPYQVSELLLAIEHAL